MVTMAQKAQLHRILENCIELTNAGNKAKFEFDNSTLRVEYADDSFFSCISFSEPMNYAHLISVAEILEKGLGYINA